MSQKRSELAHFMDTTPKGETQTYARIGKGVSDLSIDYNAQTVTNQDIDQDSATTEVTGYQPSSGVTQYANKGDAVYDFINGLRRKRAIGADGITTLLNVDIYDEQQDGEYWAEKQEIAISIDSYGGSAEDPLTIGYTISYRGDAEEGTFNPATKTFTAKVSA